MERDEPEVGSFVLLSRWNACTGFLEQTPEDSCSSLQWFEMSRHPRWNSVYDSRSWFWGIRGATFPASGTVCHGGGIYCDARAKEAWCPHLRTLLVQREQNYVSCRLKTCLPQAFLKSSRMVVPSSVCPVYINSDDEAWTVDLMCVVQMNHRSFVIRKT